MMKKRSTTSRLNIADYLIFIVCSLASLAMLYLFYRDMNSFTVKQSEEAIAKIYFKRNTAQRKFIDGDIWEVLTNSSDVYDGDRIRTSSNSEAYTEFSDGAAKIQLNEKSMVQIFQNKKERSINFIGGQISVESNIAGDDKLVIRSGKTEISISDKAEVKVAIPEADERTDGNAEESVIKVEVVSGQVQVLDKADGEKTVAEAAPVFINSGESRVLGTGLIADEKEKPKKAKTPAKEPEGPKNPVQIVKEGIEKTIKRPKETFALHTWVENGVNRHNYEFYIPMSDLTEKFKIIPKGSLLEVEVSGTPSTTLRSFAIQIGTGEEGTWRRAHGFTWTNNGGYLAGGVPFDIKKPIALDHDIVNTDKSFLGISYEQGAAEIAISDLQVKVKVLSLTDGHNTTVVESGYTKTFEYSSLTPFKEVWGSRPNDYDYKITINAEQIFGKSACIPAGKHVRISVSGSCNKEIEWFHPDLIYVGHDNWDNILVNNWDTYQLRWSEQKTAANAPFAYSRSYKLLRSMDNTNTGLFQFVIYSGAVSSQPTFSNLKITFTVE